MNLKIKALVKFKDFNILPEEVKQGQIIEVTREQYEQIKQSGGKFDILGNVIPPHVSAEEPQKAKSK